MLKKWSDKVPGSHPASEPSAPASEKEAARSKSKQSAASKVSASLVERGHDEARRCGASGENVGDFLSEYFIGCLLSPDPSNPALTCTCGTNQARSYLRRERRWKQRITLAEPAELQSLVEALNNSELSQTPCLTPEGFSLLQELQRHLLSAVGGLTEPQQRVLFLRLIEGLPFAQIAAQTGQSSAAVRVMLRSAQHRLGALLESCDFPCGEACDYLSLLEREAARKLG